MTLRRRRARRASSNSTRMASERLRAPVRATASKTSSSRSRTVISFSMAQNSSWVLRIHRHTGLHQSTYRVAPILTFPRSRTCSQGKGPIRTRACRFHSAWVTRRFMTTIDKFATSVASRSPWEVKRVSQYSRGGRPGAHCMWDYGCAPSAGWLASCAGRSPLGCMVSRNATIAVTSGGLRFLPYAGMLPPPWRI
jgi:hypothetical protein